MRICKEGEMAWDGIIGNESATKKIEKKEINTIIDFYGSQMVHGWYAIISTHFVYFIYLFYLFK